MRSSTRGSRSTIERLRRAGQLPPPRPKRESLTATVRTTSTMQSVTRPTSSSESSSARPTASISWIPSCSSLARDNLKATPRARGGGGEEGGRPRGENPPASIFSFEIVEPRGNDDPTDARRAERGCVVRARSAVLAASHGRRGFVENGETL